MDDRFLSLRGIDNSNYAIRFTPRPFDPYRHILWRPIAYIPEWQIESTNEIWRGR